jgi:hypothetical protein
MAALAIAGMLAGGGVVWGSQVYRVDRLELDLQSVVPLLHTIKQDVAVIEQRTRDTDRRIERLEK